MRRAYRNALQQWITQRKRSGSSAQMLTKGALKVLSAHVRPGLAAPWSSPILATLEFSRQCNMKCLGCASHESAQESEDLAPWKQIIGELASAGVFALGFTGGEPLLHPDFEELVLQAKSEGIITHCNTNGTLLTRRRAERLLDAGIDSINLSLDGAERSVHDRLRGAGSFDRALEGAECLVRAREQRNSTVRLLFVTRVCEETAKQVLKILDLCKETGFDGCSFMPLMEFAHGVSPPVRPSAALATRELLKAKREDYPVDNSDRYLKGMIRFFMGGAMPTRCSALHSSILVSSDQKIYPCVPAALNRQGGVNWRPGSIMKIFASGMLHQSVNGALCAGCWWNCHRELDLALGVI